MILDGQIVGDDISTERYFPWSPFVSRQRDIFSSGYGFMIAASFSANIK